MTKPKTTQATKRSPGLTGVSAARAASQKPKAPVKTAGLKANALPAERGQTRASSPIDEANLYTNVAGQNRAGNLSQESLVPAQHADIEPRFTDDQLVRVLVRLGLAKPVEDDPTVGGPATTQRKSVDLFDKDGNTAVVLSDSDVARIAAAVGLKVAPVKTAERPDRDPVASGTMYSGQTLDESPASLCKSDFLRRHKEPDMPCVDDRSPIMRSMDELDSSLFAMDEAWQYLLRKLAPVLPEEEDGKGNGRVLEASKSQLHRRIINQKDRIELMIAALNYVANTVTVF